MSAAVPITSAPPARGLASLGVDYKALPHNLDAEASILGGVILRNETLGLIGDLETDDFYDLRHKVVFQAMRNLEARRSPIDVVTLEVEIEKQEKLDAVGGVAFFGELALRVPTPDNVVAYATIVQQASRNRRAILTTASTLARMLRWPHDPADLIAENIGDLQRLDATRKPKTESDSWTEALRVALTDVQNALGSSVSTQRTPLFVDAHDLFTREYPATPWLITGLMTRGGIAQFGAEPKSGKTWFALECSIGIATGSRVCGEFFAQRGTVAYFFAEDLDRQVRNRTRALLASRGLLPEAIRGRLHVCPRGTTLDVTRNEDLAWIVASCRKLGPLDLLVLDPLRDIHSGKENESDDMSDVMRRMKTLGTILGCTVAFAHHAGKPSKDQSDRRAGQRARGSGAIHGSTDSGIYFGLRGGDGRRTFELGVDVEIKGAGGAGRFNVCLEVLDDDHGEARQATWVMSAEHATPSGASVGRPSVTNEDRADDDAVFAFVRDLESRGETLPQRKLRDHADRPLHHGKPITVTRMTSSLKRLEDNRRLVRIGGLFQVAEPTSKDLFSDRDPDASGTRISNRGEP